MTDQPQIKKYLVSTLEGLQHAKSKILESKVIGFDFETSSISPCRMVVAGVGIAPSEEEGYYFPIHHQGAINLPHDAVVNMLKEILPEMLEVWIHNASFETMVLMSLGITPPIDAVRDSMLAAIMNQESEVGLKSIAAKFRLPYQTLPASDMTAVPASVSAPYCIYDAINTRIIGKRMEKDLDERSRKVWSHLESPLAVVVGHMSYWGINFDQSLLGELRQGFQKAHEDSSIELLQLIGREINVNSPQQISKLFFQDLRWWPTSISHAGKSGNYSAAEDVLERVVDRCGHEKGKKAAELILKIRKFGKLLSTYTDGLIEAASKHQDGRIRASFWQLAAGTGRFSSSAPNLQNIPVRTEEGKQLRAAFVPESDSWELLDVDLSQIELRIIAHYSEDPVLMDAYRTGKDIHKITADQVGCSRSFAKGINFGLCLVSGTKIITKEGLQNIEDITPGTMVATHMKRWRPVVDTQALITTKTILFKTNTGKTIECTPDHKMYVYIPSRVGGYGKVVWKDAKNVHLNDLFVYHGVEFVSKNGDDDLSLSRTLGWYIAEGCYSNYLFKISQDIKSPSRQLMDRILVGQYEANKNNSCYWIPARHHKKWLFEFPELHVKSDKKRIPAKCFNFSKQAKLELLAGLWDGDGCIASSNNRMGITYYSKSLLLLRDISILLDEFGINSQTYQVKKRNMYVLHILGTESRKKFLKCIPCFKCDRVRYRPKKEFTEFEKVVSVSEINTEQFVFDLTVEEDHSFVANGLVTHNCFGMGPEKLSYTLKITRDQAWEYYKKYHATYKNVKWLYKKMEELAKSNGYIRTMVGRKRTLDESVAHMGVNTLIQGSAADLLKIAMVNLWKRMTQEGVLNERFRILLTIHDELLCEVKKDYAEEAMRIVKEVMESAVELKVPLVAEPKLGKNWLEAH